MHGLDKIRVPINILKEEIETLRQEVWQEWCFNALKDYDDTLYQGIIRGIVRLDNKELKGYKCIIQKRLVKKAKINEILERMYSPHDIDVITTGRGCPLFIMGSSFIENNRLKLDQHSVLVYATTQVSVSLKIVDEVLEEMKQKLK